MFNLRHVGIGNVIASLQRHSDKYDHLDIIPPNTILPYCSCEYFIYFVDHTDSFQSDLYSDAVWLFDYRVNAWTHVYSTPERITHDASH